MSVAVTGTGAPRVRDDRVSGGTSLEGLSSRHGCVSSLHAIGMGISMPRPKFGSAGNCCSRLPRWESLLRANTFRCDLSRANH